jgi:primary-amine oxidase
MRLPTPGAAAAAALTLLSCAEVIYARPNPQPKVPLRMQWSHNRGKKVARSALRHSLEGRQANSSSAYCSEATAASITAPKENIWAGLTDTEASSVVAWLFAQQSLNLTATEDAGPWDNTV